MVKGHSCNFTRTVKYLISFLSRFYERKRRQKVELCEHSSQRTGSERCTGRDLFVQVRTMSKTRIRIYSTVPALDEPSYFQVLGYVRIPEGKGIYMDNRH